MKFRKNKYIFFPILSYILSLLPILNIFRHTSPTLIAMRWCYFPMTFLSIFICYSIIQGFKKSRNWVIFSSTCVLLYFAFYTFTLNEYLFKKEWEFFNCEVKVFKNYFYAGSLAQKLFERGDFKEAERYFNVAMNIEYKDISAYINYSSLLIHTGRLKKAKDILINAKPYLKTIWDRSNWNNNMGMYYFKKGDLERSIYYFRLSAQSFPYEPVFWSNLANAYYLKRKYYKALEVINEGLRFSPSSRLLKEKINNIRLILKDKSDSKNYR